MRSYGIEDRISAVKNVQRLLGVNESGVYDYKTAQAVRGMQKANGTPESGVVDRATFSLILEAYRAKKSRELYLADKKNSAVLYSVGDYGSDIAEILMLLSSALLPYGISSVALRGAIYTAAVGESVRILRRIYGLPDATYVDEDLYVRIRRELLTR